MQKISEKIKTFLKEDSRQLVFYGIAFIFAITTIWFVIYASSFLADSLETVFSAVPSASRSTVQFDIAGFERLNLNR